jgi:tryptophan 2,3-dioxygenase
MNSTASGRETERKVYTAKVQAKAHSSASCSFCWFVLTVYPTLKGMTPRDSDTFREHLMKAHGLKQDIAP